MNMVHFYIQLVYQTLIQMSLQKLIYKQLEGIGSDLIQIYINQVMYVYHFLEHGQDSQKKTGNQINQTSVKFFYLFKQ
jgi:hypothetical protein